MAVLPWPSVALLKRDRTIDLLFTDIVMPGSRDGFTVAREASQWRPEIKVLFTSDDPASALPANARLPVRIIGKPYRRVDLEREIQAILAA